MSHDQDLAKVDEEAAPAELIKMVFGFRFSQVVHTAVRLGLADLLGTGEKTAGDLAEATGTHAPTLRRLLRALAAMGVLAETGPGRYKLGELGLPLRADAANSIRVLTLAAGDDLSWRAWGGLSHSVRTGNPSFDDIAGMNNFQYMAEHPELGTAYYESMARDTADLAPAIVASVDFSRFQKVIDVGGGAGTLIAAVLAGTPSLRGGLFDTPTGLRSASHVLTAAGVANRCEVVAGDFMETVPGGGDAYVLKYVLLDWDDDGCRRILANCRRAMPTDGTLLLIELVLPERTDSWTAVGDLDLLVTTGGRERTEEEFLAILRSAEFDPTSVTALPDRPDLKVVEAVPSAPTRTVNGERFMMCAKADSSPIQF